MLKDGESREVCLQLTGALQPTGEGGCGGRRYFQRPRNRSEALSCNEITA